MVLAWLTSSRKLDWFPLRIIIGLDKFGYSYIVLYRKEDGVNRMSEIEHNDIQPFLLTTGKPVTSLTTFSSPTEEYCAAFANRRVPFLHYYTFKQGAIQKRTLTRGEFWELACSAAAHLSALGIAKGDRIVHCFSANSPYDLIFRLASVLVGAVPVTINWQVDDNGLLLTRQSSPKPESAFMTEVLPHG